MILGIECLKCVYNDGVHLEILGILYNIYINEQSLGGTSCTTTWERPARRAAKAGAAAGAGC